MDLSVFLARIAPTARKLAGPARFVAVAILSVIVGMGVAGQQETVGLLVLAALAGVLCLVYPYLGATLLIVSAFSFDWVIGLGLAPSNLQIVQDILAIGLVLAIVLRTRRRSATLRFVVAGRWMLLFVVLAAFGVVVNASNIAGAVVGMRPIALFVPLAVAPLAFDWSERERRGLVSLLIGIALVQPVVALIQYAFFRSGTSGDAVSGTLGAYASGHLTAFMLGSAALMLGFIQFGGEGKRLKYVLGAAWLFLPPALNETKVFFAAAPVIFGMLLLPRLRKDFWGAVAGIALVAVATVAVFQSYTANYGASYTSRAGVVSLVESEIAGSGTAESGVLRRLPSIGFAAATVAQAPTTIVFGYGAGSLSRSGLVGQPGRLIQLYGSLVAATTFVARMILEYGFLGLLAFAAVVMSVYRGVSSAGQVSETGYSAAVAFGTKGFTLTMVLLSVYTGTFASDPLNCALWALVGVCACTLRDAALSIAGEVGEAR